VINGKELIQVLKVDHDMKEITHYFLKQVEKKKARKKEEEEKKTYTRYAVVITEKEIVPKRTREVETMIALGSQVLVQMQSMMIFFFFFLFKNL